MTTTVVAFFDNTDRAINAVNQLTNTGFTRSNVDIAFPYTHTASNDKSVNNEEGFFNKIGRFFSSLFEDQTQAEKYSEIGRRNTIVTVHAQSEEQAVAAAQILDDQGALDADIHMGNTSHATNVHMSDNTLPIHDDRLDDNSGIGTSGIRTRSRIFKRPVEKDFRVFTMDQYEDDLQRDTRTRNRNY